MKIIHCINNPSLGGIERLVIDLIIEQKKQRQISVSLMLDTNEGELYHSLIENNIEIIHSGIVYNSVSNFMSVLKMIDLFNKFDVIHLHNFSFFRNLAAFFSSSKIVYTMHGLSKGIRNQNIIKATVYEKIKSFFLNRVDFFIANSNYTLQTSIEHYSLKQTLKKVIHNGTSFIYNKDIMIKSSKCIDQNKNSKFIIGAISKFTKRKRLDRLIDGFNKYISLGGIAELVIVGNGSQMNQLMDIVKSYKLEKIITFVGYQKNIGKFYNKFDIIVHPSDNEGFGLVAIEAYSYGKPIIVFSDSGGLCEIIRPLEPEDIVKSIDGLVNRLFWYEKNYKQTEEQINFKKGYVKQNFSMGIMEANYNSLYKNLSLKK